MARMLANTFVDHAHPECPYGCCAVSGRYKNGARKEPRVRRWARKADERRWKREADNDWKDR